MRQRTVSEASHTFLNNKPSGNRTGGREKPNKNFTRICLNLIEVETMTMHPPHPETFCSTSNLTVAMIQVNHHDAFGKIRITNKNLFTGRPRHGENEKGD